MLLAIIIAIPLCVYFGLPMLPVLVGGGISMAALAYVLTRDKRNINLLIGLAIVAGSHYIMRGLLHDMPEAVATAPSWMVDLIQSDALVGVASILVICVAAFIGIFGAVRRTPTDLPGVLHMIHDAENEQRDSSK